MAAEAPGLPVWAEGVWGSIWEEGVWANSGTPDPLQITTTSLPVGYSSVAYSQMIHASGGSTDYTFSLSTGTLPPGFTLSSVTGVLSGTSTATSTYVFTLKVTDAAAATDEQDYSLIIATLPSGQKPRQSRARMSYAVTDTWR